jgi:hypothetical protein
MPSAIFFFSFQQWMLGITGVGLGPMVQVEQACGPAALMK